MRKGRRTAAWILLLLAGCREGSEESPQFTGVEGDGRHHEDVRLALLGGRPALVGGLVLGEGEPTPVTDVLEWDEESGSVTLTRDLVKPRAYHGTFSMPDGRVLVFGGLGHTFGGDGESLFTQEIEILDPAGGPSETIGALQEIRFQPIAHLEPEGTVLVFGGSFVVFAPAFERVDLKARTVTPIYTGLRRMYTDSCGVSLAPLADGTYFLIGGLQQITPDEYRYRCGGGAEIVDLQSGEARFVGDDEYDLVAEGRRALTLASGDVLVIGSRDAVTGGPWIERFDPATDAFSTLAEGDLPILYPAIVPLDDGRIFIIGNDHRDPTLSQDVFTATWIFDPNDASIEPGPSLPSPFNKPQAELLEGGGVFVLGNPLGPDDGFSLLKLAVLQW